MYDTNVELLGLCVLVSVCLPESAGWWCCLDAGAQVDGGGGRGAGGGIYTGLRGEPQCACFFADFVSRLPTAPT